MYIFVTLNNRTCQRRAVTSRRCRRRGTALAAPAWRTWRHACDAAGWAARRACRGARVTSARRRDAGRRRRRCGERGAARASSTAAWTQRTASAGTNSAARVSYTTTPAQLLREQNSAARVIANPTSRSALRHFAGTARSEASDEGELSTYTSWRHTIRLSYRKERLDLKRSERRYGATRRSQKSTPANYVRRQKLISEK